MTTPQTKKQILALYRALESIEDLQPTPAVNQAFSDLVQLSLNCSDKAASEILNDPEILAIIPRLHHIWDNSEGKLESYWTEQILASAHPAIELEQFPYYENYRKITELEYRSLRLGGERDIKRVLFIGSGPLPLSSIYLARQHGLMVDNLDKDPAAVKTSMRLIKKLGLAGAVNVHLGNAETFTRYGQYDVIFLAALVGLKPGQKQSIISAIASNMREGALLVVRTSHGLRTLLYPAVDIDEIEGLEAQSVVRPLGEAINSIIVFEKPYLQINEDIIIDDKSNPQTAERFRRFCTDVIANVYRYPHSPTWHFDIDRAEEVYDWPTSNMFIVRYKNEVIAAAAIRPYDRDYTVFGEQYSWQTGSIWRFFIKPEFDNLGLDHLLQDRIEQFARSVGYTKLYAHDQRDIPGALAKYINNGFTVTHESDESFGTVHFEKNIQSPRKQ